jgi:hypothetical protein
MVTLTLDEEIGRAKTRADSRGLTFSRASAWAVLRYRSVTIYRMHLPDAFNGR